MNTLYLDKYIYGNPVSSKYYLVLFVLWPFLAFLVALADYSHKEAKKVVYVFLIYYGATTVVDVGYYIDAVGYALLLKEKSILPFSDFFKIFSNLYSNSDSMDVLEPVLSFLVSRITTDHRMLFAIFAATFGFFYLKSINLLHRRYLKSPNLDALIFMGFFSLLLPVMAISGFRMWTAMWIFLYAAYHVVTKRDMRYFILAFSAVLVHWSFVSVCGILVVYFFARNRDIIYIPLAIVSFIVPYLIAPFLTVISLRMGGVFQERYDMYSNEAYASGVQDQLQEAAWFMQIGNDLVMYFLLFAIIIIKFRFGDMMKGKTESNLFSFNLLLLTFVNVGKTVPSLGGRFQMLFFLFATMYVFLFFVKKPPGKTISYLTLVGLFPMLLNTLIVIRQGSDTINAWIFAPGLGIPFFMQDINLASVLF
ncbi:EpsG family protein [Saccharicrinis carchari]|uniref:EpsG family protein n=1 Tax=Saccharicrinis carchari TaxID=1168039 RepID=A0A521BSJ3_SACCC|nr:EpsG family protein [Saccharicrinis carchari]SMO50025.1 EpsG family protein [Saccharicrinis carchari]